MKVIDKFKELYPDKSIDFLMENACPHHQFNSIKMNLSDCLSFETCNDCWNQEVNENESYNV